MVLEKVRKRLEEAKAKHHGMTVDELRAHLKKRKEERKKFKMELREKEQFERQKFERWKIQQKYKERRRDVKSGKKSSGPMGFLNMLGGGSETRRNGYFSDPFGVFGPPQQPTKRREKHRPQATKTKRKRRRTSSGKRRR